MDREGLQFFYFYTTMFGEGDHHGRYALAALMICSADAKLFAG
jgi:hypothetical protein